MLAAGQECTAQHNKDTGHHKPHLIRVTVISLLALALLGLGLPIAAHLLLALGLLRCMTPDEVGQRKTRRGRPGRQRLSITWPVLLTQEVRSQKLKKQTAPRRAACTSRMRIYVQGCAWLKANGIHASQPEPTARYPQVESSQT